MFLHVQRGMTSLTHFKRKILKIGNMSSIPTLLCILTSPTLTHSSVLVVHLHALVVDGEIQLTATD